MLPLTAALYIAVTWRH